MAIRRAGQSNWEWRLANSFAICARYPANAAIDRLVRLHDLDQTAAENALRYLDDQAATGAIPDDRTLVIERCLDDLGDWRVCLLSPLGSRVHAPWAMAVTAHIRSHTGMDVEVMWGDEGFVVRFPEVERPPDPALLLPEPEEIEGLVLRQLGSTSLFAARFRETAARALLLPRRRPGMRTPLWQQRKAGVRSAGCRVALRVVSRAARNLSRGAARPLRHARAGRRASSGVEADAPRRDDRFDHAVARSRHRCSSATSPTTSTTATPRWPNGGRRRSRSIRASSVSCLATRSCANCSTRPRSTRSNEQLQYLDESRRVKTPDGIHDLLLRIGDLTLDEIQARSSMPDTAAAIAELERARTNRRHSDRR